jgi:hypothetical protein
MLLEQREWNRAKIKENEQLYNTAVYKLRAAMAQSVKSPVRADIFLDTTVSRPTLESTQSPVHEYHRHFTWRQSGWNVKLSTYIHLMPTLGCNFKSTLSFVFTARLFSTGVYLPSQTHTHDMGGFTFSQLPIMLDNLSSDIQNVSTHC